MDCHSINITAVACIENGGNQGTWSGSLDLGTPRPLNIKFRF